MAEMDDNKRYDVVVIGAGPGGYVAAIRAAQRGASAAVVEKEFLGGTCLNWGCIPTKCLIGSANALEQIHRAAEFGIALDGTAKPDWEGMLQRKNGIVKNLRKGIGGLLKSNQVDVIEGSARFADRGRIVVATKDGELTVAAGSTIIATGSDSVAPPFVPEAGNILYSRSALDNGELPESIIVLGGGVIGSEFACMYAKLGVEVTLVEMLPQILPMVDGDVARTVRNSMKRLGVEVLCGTPLSELHSDGHSVSGKVGGRSLSAQQMLVCVGRRAYADGLDLDAIGLRTDGNGLIEIDGQCRTKVPGVYAIGDVAGSIQYAHRASAMGIVAANNATGLKDSHSDALVPGCIFTSPEIGTVGLSEEDAKARELDVNVGKFPFMALGKAMIHGETDGFYKIVADASTDQVLGVQIVGPHATDLVAEAATAMAMEVTAEEMGRAIHAHPTLGEASMEAAHAVHGECIHLPKPRR
jgi:dihydrolipoamide dehydrogenase